MGYRIGKRYIKMACPMCQSVYLLEKHEVLNVEVEQVKPEDEDDDGKRYRYQFFCEECKKTMYGCLLGTEIATDAYIKDCVSQMEPVKTRLSRLRW